MPRRSFQMTVVLFSLHSGQAVVKIDEEKALQTVWKIYSHHICHLTSCICLYKTLCNAALLKSLGMLWLCAGGKAQNTIQCAGASPLHLPRVSGALPALLQTSACLGWSFYINSLYYILSHARVWPKKCKPCSWQSLFQYRWSSQEPFILHICVFSFTISICSRPLVMSYSYFDTSPKRVKDVTVLLSIILLSSILR